MDQLELNLEPETETDKEIKSFIKKIKAYDKEQVYAVYCHITNTNWPDGHPLSLYRHKSKLINACLKRRDEVFSSDEL